MKSRAINYGWRFALVSIGALFISGCLSVKLISDYDEQIDSGVTQVLSDTTTFVNKMTPLAGTAAGEYTANQDFYTTEEGKISALEARADANKVFGVCPSTAVVAAAITGVGSLSKISNDPSIKAKFASYSASIKNDDCEVVALQQLYQEMEDLKGFHIAQGAKGIPTQAVNPILVGGIGATVEVIIAVEAAKKAGQSGSKTSGA